VRRAFVSGLLDELAPEGTILAVCAGADERDLLPDATLSDISTGQDAQALPYGDASFDYTFVSDGLHHCSRPHLALTEMYRVARKGVIVVEASDNLVTRLAVRLGLTQQYELEAVRGNGGTFGGVDNTSVPNYVYRWTEREFEKTLRSFDPTGPIQFRYLYALSLPERVGVLRKLERPAGALLRTRTNTMAMVAYKPQRRWPWLERDG
jgi:SAM-dependent methyltransferase